MIDFLRNYVIIIKQMLTKCNHFTKSVINHDNRIDLSIHHV